MSVNATGDAGAYVEPAGVWLAKAAREGRGATRAGVPDPFTMRMALSW